MVAFCDKLRYTTKMYRSAGGFRYLDGLSKELGRLVKVRLPFWSFWLYETKAITGNHTGLLKTHVMSVLPCGVTGRPLEPLTTTMHRTRRLCDTGHSSVWFSCVWDILRRSCGEHKHNVEVFFPPEPPAQCEDLKGIKIEHHLGSIVNILPRILKFFP